MNDEQKALLREIYQDRADAVISAFERLAQFMNNPDISVYELANPALYGKVGLKRESFLKKIRAGDVAGELDAYRTRLEANAQKGLEGARIREGDLAITLRENVPGLKGISYKNQRTRKPRPEGRLVNTGQGVWSDQAMGNPPRYS